MTSTYAYISARRAELRRLGLCIYNGSHGPSDAGELCKACREKQRAYSAARGSSEREKARQRRRDAPPPVKRGALLCARRIPAVIVPGFPVPSSSWELR